MELTKTVYVCVLKNMSRMKYMIVEHVHTFFVVLSTEEVVVEEVVWARGGSQGPA